MRMSGLTPVLAKKVGDNRIQRGVMSEESAERRRQGLQWVRFALGTGAIILVVFSVVFWFERTLLTNEESVGRSLLHQATGFAAAMLATLVATYLLVKRTRTAERRARLVEESMDNVFQIMDALPTGVMVVDREGRPFYANQAAEEVLGQGLSSDATSERLSEVYQAYVAGTNDLYPADRMPLFRALQGEQGAIADDVEIRRAKDVVPVKLVANATHDEGGRVHHAVASVIDLRDFRKPGDRVAARGAKRPG